MTLFGADTTRFTTEPFLVKLTYNDLEHMSIRWLGAALFPCVFVFQDLTVPMCHGQKHWTLSCLGDGYHFIIYNILTYTYATIYIYVHVYIYIYTYMCMHVYVYIYIYTYAYNIRNSILGGMTLWHLAWHSWHSGPRCGAVSHTGCYLQKKIYPFIAH